MPDSTIPVIDNDATPAELVFFFGNHDEIRKLIRSRGRFLLCAPQYARRIYTALTDGSLGSGDNPGVMKLLSLLLCSATFAVGEAPNPVIDIDRFAILTKEVG